MKQPLKKDLERALAEKATRGRVMLMAPGPERDRAALLLVVDAVLTAPRRLPPIPKLAEDHSARIADRLRSPGSFTPDQSGASSRLKQFEIWYSLVKECVLIDGVQVLIELAKLCPDESSRFNALLERLRAMLRALRELSLPWWPMHGLDAHSHRELSLLDYCEQRLGMIETWQIRRGGAVSTSEKAGVVDPLQRVTRHSPAPDPRIKDEWSPAQESIL